jgi:hypothetical protein
MRTAVGRREPGGSRRVLFWGALVAVVVAIVVVATRGGSPERAPQAPAAGSAGEHPAIEPPGTRPIATEKIARGGAGAPGEVMPDRDVDLREVYANFLELARFPPLSRPLGPDQHDLLRPYARYESPVVITEPTGNVRPDPDDLYYGILTADRYALVGGEKAAVWFKVWKGEKEGPGVAVQIDAVNVVGLSGGGEDEVGAITLAPVEEGGGTTYRGVLDLAALGAQRAGEYRVDLYFRGPDGEPVGGRLDFLYTPAVAVPAKFTGKFRDSVQNGSLVVSFQVDVSRAGRYDFNANLIDRDGKPVGWSRAIIEEMAPGKHWVDLQYFGLIFHDQKASGWFELDQLRGHRSMPGETPDRELMPPPGKRHRTASYRLEDFSSAEWDAPEKHEQIQMYERLIREQDQGVTAP